MITRRELLKMGIAGAGLLLLPGWRGSAKTQVAYAFTSSPTNLKKFAQPLRGVFPLDPNGIPVALPDGVRTYAAGHITAQHYTVEINQFTDMLHPQLGPTTLWGFQSVNNLGGAVPQRHLGGIIVAEKGKPIQLTFRNRLPNQHILPVDTSIMGADLPQNRTSVHFHGGDVPWMSDGGPFAWFRPQNGAADQGPFYGESAEKGSLNIFKVLNPNLKTGEAEYYYPINQSARFGWYHDHAVGITRLNAYSGIASALLIRDNFERSLVKTKGLPDFIENGGREIPLIIQEKIFVGSDIDSQDPDWKNFDVPQTPGSLWYPHRYESRWGSDPDKDPGAMPVSAIPEMFGDTMLVNGVVYPFLPVEPRRYRLRVLNATQARFLNLQLYVETAPGSGVPDFHKPGPDFLIIGTEGGFLARPVVVKSGRRLNIIPVLDPQTNQPTGDRMVDPANAGGSLLTAPAERWDIVIDFKGYAGKNLILYNDAPAPFPMGDQLNDGPVQDGVLLNQTLLRVEVGQAITLPADPPLAITPNLPLAGDRVSGIAPALVGNWATVQTHPLAAPEEVRVRRLTLNEIFDEKGRLIQMLGTNKLRDLPPGFTYDLTAPQPGAPQATAMGYMDAATETPARGAVEVWEIANLTGDVHPMHFHLVNVQVLSRRPFSDYVFDEHGHGAPVFQPSDKPRGPAATELGWKDTVRMNPNEVTTIIMKFDLQPVPFVVPPSPRTGGNEYVWHCHILEHEEHDMMRPLIVTGKNPLASR